MDALVPFLPRFLEKLPQKTLDPRAWSQFSKWHNWTFDALFYDVRRVPAELWDKCADTELKAGTVVILKRVPEPQAKLGRTFAMSSYKTTDAVPMDGIRALAIAGVGSSALGTVALAVDVADALGGEVTVAGVITGEGRRDALQEALGGWYVLRQANMVRQWMENLTDLTKLWLDRNLGIPISLSEQFLSGRFNDTDLTLPESEDIVRFLEKAPGLELVVGHSKGGLYLANALSVLADEWRDREERRAALKQLVERLTIVTLGAVIYPPQEFCSCLHQFLGEADGFGQLNSRQQVEKTVIPGVMHHLNSALPMHMSCNKVLRSHFPQLITKP